MVPPFVLLVRLADVVKDVVSVKADVAGLKTQLDSVQAGRKRGTFLPRFCSRTLMDCVALLRRGGDAIHQCPLDAVALYSASADVRSPDDVIAF